MFKVLDEVCEPKRGTKYSAYVDLFARENVVIGAGETKIVPLGVKLDMQYVRNTFWAKDLKEIEKDDLIDFFMLNHYLEVALRSSLAVKGLIIANGSGKVDLDYPDEIGLIVHNPIDLNFLDDYSSCNGHYKKYGEFRISKGDKVAQCTLIEHKGFLLGYESNVVREGGFGSTGKV